MNTRALMQALAGLTSAHRCSKPGLGSTLEHPAACMKYAPFGSGVLMTFPATVVPLTG